MTTRREHQDDLQKRANLLVNVWPRAITEILKEMNRKLARLGLQLAGYEQDLCPDGKSVGARLSIWGSYSGPTAPAGVGHSLRLDLKLTEAGNVEGSVFLASPDGFEPREMVMGEDFPEQEVRQILADFAGYRLRNRTIGSR